MTAVVDKTLKLDKEAVRESAARRRRLHDKKSVVPSRESFCVLFFGFWSFASWFSAFRRLPALGLSRFLSGRFFPFWFFRFPFPFYFLFFIFLLFRSLPSSVYRLDKEVGFCVWC